MAVRATSVRGGRKPFRLMRPARLPVPGGRFLAVTKERSIPFMFHECTSFHHRRRTPAGRSPRPLCEVRPRGHRAAGAGSKLRELISQVGRRGKTLKGGSWVPAVQEPHPARGELPLLPIPTPASPPRCHDNRLPPPPPPTEAAIGDPSAMDAPSDPPVATSSSRLPPLGNVRLSSCSTHLALTSILGPPQGVFLHAPIPCRAAMHTPCGRGHATVDRIPSVPPAPQGSPGRACNDDPQLYSSGHACVLTHADTPGPSDPTGVHSEWQVWGEGGELKWQKFRGAGSRTVQRLGGGKDRVESAEH